MRYAFIYSATNKAETFQSWLPDTRQLGIIHRTKSVIINIIRRHRSIYKAFVHSLMEYCSLLYAGFPASHLAQHDAMETKVFKMIGISHDEAESLVLSLSHRRQVGDLSVFYHLLSGLAPPALLRFVPTTFPQGAQGPPTTPFW